MSKELCPRCKADHVIESSHTKDGKFYCLVCSGIMVVEEQDAERGKSKSTDGPNMPPREEIEFARALFEGGGQLRGQKIERAQIVYHLKALAARLRDVLPNSPDAHVISDIAFMLERREHWTKLDPDNGPDGE